MSKIKLEVGKTYRSRNGEEVRIVAKNNGARYPYRGDDDEWYAESGRYEYVTEGPKDLIEEVGSPRHTFDIPDGVKLVTVEQVGNRIVVEMVPEDVETPKPGDVMVNTYGSVYIFKSIGVGIGHIYFALLGSRGRLDYNNVAIPGRPATPEEAKPLFDALKKAGKRWNAETMQVEDVPESEHIMDYLKDYENNVKWNHEQLCWLIEQYLRHKEAK